MPSKINDIRNELDSKYKKILSNKKNINFIVELIKTSQTDSKQQIRLYSSSLLLKLFSNYLQNGVITQNKKAINDKNSEILPEIKFQAWIHDQYENYCEFLIDNLDSANRSDREKIENLDSLFQCIKEETKSRINLSNDGDSTFSFDLLHKTLEKILLNLINIKLIKKLCKYLEYKDIRYFTLKYIDSNFEDLKSNETFIENLINLLSLIPGLIKGDKTSEATSLFVLEDISENSNLLNIDYHRKIFSDCIFKILHLELNLNLYKKMMIKFPEKLLPKMSNPLMCADFLNKSYQVGGLISILALDSLYVLISKYNIEIPEFYKKIYEQLNPSIFNTKYKSRYFALLDTCLSSTHLSVYLVAAFMKKISRLLLFAPSTDTKVLLRFITNLAIRHPTCKQLIHRKNGKSISGDPFDINSTNLNQTTVINSSVWEVQAIANHYSPSIAQEIKFLNSLPKNESDVFELLDDNNFDNQIENEMNRNYQSCPLLGIYNSEAFKNNNFFN
jgi:U3 small nucleolar RNA-associated protein 19